MTDVRLRITASDETKRAFKEVGFSLNSMQRSVAGVKTQIGLLVGSATGIGLMAKSVVDSADAIAKQADKLGLSTAALQEYRFAAEKFNVEQNTLDMAMQRFTRRLGEADAGTGELAGILEQLGISTRDAAGNIRTTEDVLNEYANAIQNAESDQERLRLAFKAFDSEGAALVNMLRNGSDGLNDYRQQARDAGAVLDEHLIRKAEIANEKWQALTTTIGVKFKTAMLNVLDLFLDLSTPQERVKDLDKEIKTLVASIERMASMGSVTGVYDVDRLQAETEQLRLLREEREKLLKQLETRDNRINPESRPTDQKATGNDGEQKKLNPVMSAEEFDLEFARAEEQFAQLNELYQTNQSYFTGIYRQGLDERQKFLQLSGAQQVKQVATDFQAIIGTATQSNKTLFNINKIAGIANAVVNTAEGVTKTLSAYPFPLNVAMAASSFAAGLAQINTIKSQSFGGGGGGSAPSGAGSVPRIPDVATPGADAQHGRQAVPVRVVDITMHGSLFNTQQVRELVEAIQKEAPDMNLNLTLA